MSLISICIPSYNRPFHLLRLLQSIKVDNKDDIEIIICEDKSPKRDQIIKIVESFKKDCVYKCELFLNEINLGYDENLKQLIKKSNGEYIMYMGDDDIFQSNSLNLYIDFLKGNLHLGYILRRYSLIHNNGSLEEFIYYNNDRFFEPGKDAFRELFRKSVFISGFCFRRELVLPYFDTTKFNGTLLYQLFICGKLLFSYPSAYCNIPLTLMDENERGIPEFGSSINESNIYTPGHISVQNSINFMKSFLKITNFLDEELNVDATAIFLNDLSKYSYPVLSIQRQSGFFSFLSYNKQLIKEININKSNYYYIYFISLLIFGKKICDLTIINIKKIVGKTPKL